MPLNPKARFQSLTVATFSLLHCNKMFSKNSIISYCFLMLHVSLGGPRTRDTVLQFEHHFLVFGEGVDLRECLQLGDICIPCLILKLYGFGTIPD